MNDVEELFSNSGIKQPGGWFILPKEVAIKFVEACKEQKIDIIAIEAFYVRENGIQPSMDNSADYSSKEFRNNKNIYDDAVVFLKGKSEEMFFEIVCGT